MTRSRSRMSFAGVGAAALVAVVVAGCGGGNGGGNSAQAAKAPAPRTAGGHAATVGVANTSIGNVLVNSQGRTVYLFAADMGSKSACSGACAGAWPPVRTSGKPTAGNGLKSSLLGTIKRSDGKPQVTYNHHPLYLYSGDQKPGDTNGQKLNAFGAPWFALTSSGNQSNAAAVSTGGPSGY